MSWSAIVPILVTVAAVTVSVVGVAHVVLNKRDVRAAIGWSGLILLSPFVGAIAYSMLGINRIRRRAARLSGKPPGGHARSASPVSDPEEPSDALPPELADEPLDSMARLAMTVTRVTGRPLVEGNTIEPLVDGDQAYPEMLRAIESAERSILLTSYIFDRDPLGERFVDALADAVARGVRVRVLIDGVGVGYSRPTIRSVLRDRGIETAIFLPVRFPLLRRQFVNLRNHRKTLIVDGRLAFAGGLNIRQGCLLESDPDEPIQDLHFSITGPVVESLFEISAEDWQFATQEKLDGPAWAIDAEPTGDVALQAFGDGPGEDFETLRWTILAGLAAARTHVRIETPYFLPDQPLIAGLRLAVLRGVEVEILLPEVNNLRFVHWAAMAQLWQVLEPGCRVWLVPPPFDHSKAMVVDGKWSLIGSGNWDMRSLRLNFELGVACYDRKLARELLALTDAKKERGRELGVRELADRPLPARLRDGAVRLLAPYL